MPKNKNEYVSLNIVDSIEGLELADSKPEDLLLLQGVAFHNGINARGAYIEKADAKKDIHTMKHKPIRILWDGNNPTNHGLDTATGKFDEGVKNIGYVHNAFIQDGVGDEYKAIVQAVIWEKYYPEIGKRLRELHGEDRLRFSIEAERDAETKENGSYKCYNNNFRGLSVVKSPAWKNTTSLLVADSGDGEADSSADDENDFKNKEDKEVGKNNKEKKDMGEAKEKQQETQQKNNTSTPSSAGNEESRIQALEMEKKIEGLTKELNEYRTIVEQYQIEKVGKERFEKLNKYKDCKPEQIDEFGKMTTNEFLDLYEQTLDEYSKGLSENNEENSDTQLHGLFHSDKQEQVEAKDALLQLFRGFNN